MACSQRIVVMNMLSCCSPAEMRANQICAYLRNISHRIYYRFIENISQAVDDARRLVASTFNAPVLDIIIHKGAVSVSAAVCCDRRNLPPQCRVHCKSSSFLARKETLVKPSALSIRRNGSRVVMRCKYV